MKYMKRFAAFTGVFGLGYAASTYSRMQSVNLDKTTDARSEKLRDYLKEHKFQYPKFFDSYMSLRESDHFLEKLILQKSEGLEHYKIFLSEDLLSQLFIDTTKVPVDEKIPLFKMCCVFTAGSQVQSHQNIVHGGFQATLIDNMFGYLGTLAGDFKPCATATLQINYKKPVKVGEEYIIKLAVDKIDGRKINIKAIVEDQHGVVHTESSALMISVNWGASQLKTFVNKLHQASNIVDFSQEKQQQQIPVVAQVSP